MLRKIREIGKEHVKAKLDTTFAAFRHRNYRLWFFGQMFSLFGTWMQMTAQGFLVYELTKSSTYLGILGFASGLPIWLFTLYGGIISDRVSKRNLMVLTQIAMMILAFVLGGLTFLKVVQPWHILILAFLLGTANAFDAPARQAFVVSLVERQDLTNAVAMNGIMFNTAMVVGPAIGGLTYALVGPAWCFIINGLSFLTIIISLLLMNIPPPLRKVSKGSIKDELTEGINYVKRDRVILGLTLVMGFYSLFGLAFTTLLPAWSVAILHGDATTNGLLQSARGIGALLAAFWIASLGQVKFKSRILSFGAFLAPVMILIFSFTRSEIPAIIVLVGLGVANILIVSISSVIVQMRCSDELRGRVMSINTFVFFGLMPLSSLWIGTLAGRVGDVAAVFVSSILLLASFLVIWRFVPELSVQE